MEHLGLKSLWQIIHALRQEEVDICKRYLKAFNRRGTTDTHFLKLFEAILNDENGTCDEENIKAFVHENISGQAFRKLYFRLKQKVLDVILMDINIDRNGAYTERAKIKLLINKRIAQAHVLHTRSLIGIACVMYESIIEDGTTFEFWEEVLQAQRLKMGLIGLSKGRRAYEKESSKLNSYLAIYQAVLFAERKYNDIGLVINFRLWNQQDTEKLKNDISELYTLLEVTNSKTVELFIRYLEAHYYQVNNQFEKADIHLKRIAHLTKNEKAVATLTRYSSSIINLAQNTLYMGQYTVAFRQASEALKLNTKKHITSLFCVELQFFACFYQQEYFKARIVITKGINNAEDSYWHYQKGKLTYYLACCCFASGDYQSVDNLLNEINPIEEDKEGWNIAIRLLLILNNIERRKLDLASDRIETTRKLMNTIRKRSKMRKRTEIVFSVLKVLEKSSFNFQSSKADVSIFLAQLESNNEENKWQILSWELIIFHEWFACKIKNEPFKQTIPIQSTSHMLKVI
jgi:hypothetical protein